MSFLEPRNVISIVGIVVAISTYIWSRNRETRIQKANFVRDYIGAFYQDDRICSKFFEIDFEKFIYSQDILQTEEEINLSRLLDLFNSLGFNWTKGIISLDDIDETTLGYAIWRVRESEEVKKYLEQIDAHPNNHGLNIVAFRHFRDLGDALGMNMREQKGTGVNPRLRFAGNRYLLTLPRFERFE